MRPLSTLLIVAITLLARPSAGVSQPTPRLEIDGTIQAVDCAAQQLTIGGESGTAVLQSTLATLIDVDGQPQPLCALQQFVGAPATVSIVPASGQLMIGRLTVRTAAAASPPASPVPALVGAVLGTLVVAGLAYLLVQGANGALYRYPYYGPYRQTYYQPSYRPYVGPLRPMMTYGPYRRCRDHTWSQWCY